MGKRDKSKVASKADRQTTDSSRTLYRDSKGQFASRNLPDDSPSEDNGLSRGKKATDDLITAAETVATELMSSRDKKLRATGAKLAVKIKTFRRGDVEDAPTVPASFTLKVIPIIWMIGEMAQERGVSKEELIRRMITVCPRCECAELGKVTNRIDLVWLGADEEAKPEVLDNDNKPGKAYH